MTPDSAVHATGCEWTDRVKRQEHNICTLEGFAVANALADFGETIEKADLGALHIVVDNTSVQHALHKARAKAEALNEALVDSLDYLKSLNIRVTVRYIHTSQNPADSVSRGKEPEWAVALGIHERWGGGGSLSVLVNPLRESNPLPPIPSVGT